MNPFARDRLTTTLFVAAAVHALIILGVTFSSGPPSKLAPGLEVLLISDEVPEARNNPKARYLAQRTQLGNGNTRELPTGSPLQAPPVPPGENATRPGSAATDLRVLSTPSQEPPEINYFADLSEQAAPSEASGMPGSRALSGRGDSPELLLRGEPGKQRWLVADTQMSVIAPYLDAWRHKVERIGTLNYPSAARAASNRARPVIEVVINASGRLESARVQRSSGQADLDQAALDILRAASPFEAFPRALANRYLRLRFAYEWDFVVGGPASSVTVGTNDASGP